MLTATDPFSFVLFGASGHLAKIKIYPALYTLASKQKLPEDYAIVGFSRTELTDEEFRTLVSKAIHAKFEVVDEVILQELLSHVYYHTGQYTEAESFTTLRARLEEIEFGWASATRIAYYSVPPGVFGPISQHINTANLRAGTKALRLIVEKPIGSDLQSFQEIRDILTAAF